MIPELGHFALVIALVLSFMQAVFPIWGTLSHQDKLCYIAKPLSLGVSFFIALSFLTLLYAFSQDDFSVKYVSLHSNSALPFSYKLSAAWAGHEGSLLLWILLLSLWTLCFTLSSKALPKLFVSRVLSCLAWVNFGFLLFLLITSNPFLRELPEIPLDGVDLNPLLQDPGLIFHPPLLYMGYVGSSIVAAFAVATLWENAIPQGFATWVRPWVLAYFGFLTIGIAWGSYWAYYELGWGGWWFWDPVENASFLPWLTSLALIHSLIVVKKRNQLYAWTILLMILSFGLSLLGTFLVRSGVLTSVHAFATDPRRGVFILLLLTVLIGTAFVLYAFRGRGLFKEQLMELTSREALLLFNSILIVIAAASILLGTLFPLGYEFFSDKKISVGFPYFNLIFIPLMIPVLFSIPLGPFVRWGDNKLLDLAKKMGPTFFASVGLAFAVPLFMQYRTQVPLTVLSVLGFFCAFWVGMGTLQRLWHKIKEGGIRKVSVGAWGMIIAHFGIAVIVLGITVVSNYQIEQDVRLSPNESVTLRNYQIRFLKIEPIEGSNFVGNRGSFSIEHHGKLIAELTPEKRSYVIQNTTLSETAIDAGFWRDIYIALGDRVIDNIDGIDGARSRQVTSDADGVRLQQATKKKAVNPGIDGAKSQQLTKEEGATPEQLVKETWTLRVYYKPGVRWIWAGALMVAFACLILLVFRKSKKHS